MNQPAKTVENMLKDFLPFVHGLQVHQLVLEDQALPKKIKKIEQIKDIGWDLFRKKWRGNGDDTRITLRW